MNYYLSIDIGTHAIKGALFDENTNMIHRSTSTFGHYTQATWYAQFTGVLTEVVLQLCTSLLKTDILYIVVSGNGPSLVCLDEQDEVVQFVSWKDDKQVYLENTNSYFLPQLQYLKENQPDIFSRIAWVLPPAEYVGFLFTGKKNIWIPHLNYEKYIWTQKDIQRYNMTHIEFAPFCISGTFVAKADSDFANTLFCQKIVDKNIHFVAGGLDYLSALIGGNAISGRLFQRSGTSVALNIAVCKSSNVYKSLPSESKDYFALPHFFEEYINIGYIIKDFDDLYSQIKNTKENEQIIDVLFERIKKRYDTLFEIADLESTDNHLIVSGGHAHDEWFMRLYSKKLGIRVMSFKPQECELLGNLALALVANQSFSDVRKAIQHIHTHTPKITFG